ncbi:hypothetical protein Taro_030283 [Colocasia esculenta]|uniref:Uncharacterized protein n=1 Tax=Colocasia esculenta TaxID=4460 RepID=A0A843VNP6_COLES|nr:hypothetical protein [Colocasia esculenta]
MWRPISPNVKESESYDHKNDDMSKQDATPISAHQEHGDLPPQISELNSELYPSLFDPKKVVENANPHEKQMVDVSSICLGAENQQPPANNVAQRKAHQMFDDMQSQKSELVPVNAALEAPDRKPHTAGQVHVEATMLPHEDTPTAAPSRHITFSSECWNPPPCRILLNLLPRKPSQLQPHPPLQMLKALNLLAPHRGQKTDWSKAPFVAAYRNFNANACVASRGTSSNCASYKSPASGSRSSAWWNPGAGRHQPEVVERQKPLLIVAEDVESDALATLILDKLHAGIKVCAIKAPGFGENMKASLHDLSILTGGDVRIISVFFYDVLLIQLNFLFYG